MIEVKLVLLITILLAGAAGAAMPLLRRDSGESGRVLGWGNAFAAGVFLAAGMVHMLPDADRTWAALGYAFPMAFALAALAFVLMLLVEHVLLPERAHEELHVPSAERFTRLAEQGGHGQGKLQGHGQGHSHGHDHAIRPAGDGSVTTDATDSLGAYAVLTALSIHSLLSGLALGTEPELSRALVISFAIIAHKSAAGFALGVSLARSALPARQAWTLVALFSLATPMGGVIGAVLGESIEGDLGAILEASFLSIAAGTFIYVATFDILRDEFPAPGGRFAKWCVLTAAVVSMSALALWT